MIPQILLIAFQRQLFDEPNERKIHHCAVPRLGGIAFKPVVLFSISLLLGINIAMGYTGFLSGISSDVRALSFAFCAIMVLYLVGIADDLIGVRYSAKFVIQIMCGVMLICGGTWIYDLHGALWLHSMPMWAGYPLTVLVTVFIINAINLIDGIDGLASGLCGIAFLFYGVTFFLLHQYFYAMLSFATLGVLVPFFCYNVFGNAEHGRKIFMGDTGSLTIGMTLCFLCIKLMQHVPNDGADNSRPLVLACAPLLIPCFDVIRVYLHRVRSGKNPFLPDKSHIHHKLLALGFKPHVAMITIISTSALLVIINILLSRHINVNWLLLGNAAAYTIANIRLTARIRSRAAAAGSN